MSDLGLMSTAELAAAGGWSLNTLAYWRQIGAGPKWARIGRRVVYRRADVDQWIADQFTQAEKGR